MRAAVCLAALLAAAPSARAQEAPPPLGSAPRVFAGAAIGPGVGAVAGVSRPVVGVLTAEGALYLDYTPRVAGGAGRLLTSVGVGGTLRATRALAVVTGAAPGAFDLDVGVRLGPAFYTAFFEQTAASQARAFRVMTDAFARGTLRLASRRVVFAEVGTQAPALRAGVATTLGRSAVR